MTYYHAKEFEVTDEGYVSKGSEGRKVFSPSLITGRIEKEVRRRPKRFKSIIMVIIGFFVLSEMNVSKAPFPPALALIVSVILFSYAFYLFTTGEVQVDFTLTNGKLGGVTFSSEREADKFIKAMQTMLDDYATGKIEELKVAIKNKQKSLA